MAVPLNSLLKSVSRSFYLSLRVLPSGIRSAMGVGYLLCRAADTVADTPVLPADRRRELISEIRNLFSVFPLPPDRAATLATALREGLTGDPTPERILITRFDECLAALTRLTNTDRALTQRVVVAVATGMEDDLRRFGTDSDAVTAMETADALEKYIGWIGGEPGLFWTDVCAAHGVRFAAALPEMRRLGHRFGTGLQMVNILRDLPADIKTGRCYIPLTRLRDAGLTPEDLRDPKNEDRFRGLYHGLVDDTVDRLRAGLDYVAQLPRTAVALRAAVWWPLALGLRTLGLLRSTPSVLGRTAPVKVARRDVYWLMATSLPELPFNRLLRGDFRDLAEPATSSAGL